MRLQSFIFLSFLGVAGATLAHATAAPVGVYTMSAHTTSTGVHQSLDQGTLTGTLTFNASSVLTAANLTFNDTTSGKSFSYTVVGPTTTSSNPSLEAATITDAADASLYDSFSILLPSTPSGSFTLTCGTDCDNDVEINDHDGRGILNEELLGSISPAGAPEPSSLILLGTGVLAGLGAVRRRWMKS